MKIASVAIAVPSMSVSNGQVLEMVRRANEDFDRAALEDYCDVLASSFFEHGAVNRFIRDIRAGELAEDSIRAAIERCLADAGVKPSDVDLLIYCGVGRGFVEPANAAFVCRLMGMQCENFDLSEACMSWMRALHVSTNLLRGGSYSRILVVNGEFNAFPERLSHALKLKSKDQLRYSAGALTIGEAASATLLVASDGIWNFRFSVDPAKFALCTIPIEGFESFARDDGHIGRNGPNQLVSFGSGLFAAGRSMLRKYATDYRDIIDQSAVLIPHAATARQYETAAGKLGLKDKLYVKVFPLYGNIVSASIPAALRLALDESRISKGERIAFCPVSAGISSAFVDTVF